MKLPTLYKKTSTGAIQFWTISTSATRPDGRYGVITTEYGQVGTESPQMTEDIVTKGKNAGKKNATTPIQQAELEAQAKWEKQKKKGYVETPTGAALGETDALIEGGIVPMLAHKFADHGHKIKYPAYIQPKLDGIRCIAILKDGKCTLWTRTRKPITGVPHVIRAIEEQFKEDITLDGELYNHAYKANFEQIVSYVRQEEPIEGHEAVQYHIYDMVSALSFKERIEWLHENLTITDTLKCVLTTVTPEADVMDHFNIFRQQGYEGAMLRNADSLYVNKRSYDLLKVKEFDDAEFDIIGIDEGRGKLAGHVGSFICQTDEGKQFFAKMSGDTEMLRTYFNDHDLWKGKRLTVKYQGLTGKEKVPRFPVGVSIRDYE